MSWYGKSKYFFPHAIQLGYFILKLSNHQVELINQRFTSIIKNFLTIKLENLRRIHASTCT